MTGARTDPDSTPGIIGAGGHARPIGPRWAVPRSGEWLAEPALHGGAQRLERNLLVRTVRGHLDLVTLLDLERRHREHAARVHRRGPGRHVADAHGRAAVRRRGPDEGRARPQMDPRRVADGESDRLHGLLQVVDGPPIVERSAVGRPRVVSQAAGEAAAAAIMAARAALTGVGTPAASPARATAPLSQGASDGPPPARR